MKVILRTDVKGLGSKGDILSVKTGYARNYLLLRSLAYEYTPGNIKQFELEKSSRKVKDIKNKETAEEMVAKLADFQLTISQKAHDDDMLYGSVSNALISKELEKQEIIIEKAHILLDEPIRKLGVYEIPVKLHSDVEGTLKVWVIKDE